MFGLDPGDAASALTLLADLRPLADAAAAGAGAERAAAAAARARLVAAAQAATPFTPGDLPPGAGRPSLDLPACRVSPLCREPGRAALAARCVLFRPVGAARATAVLPLDALGAVLKRRWRLDDVGLELFLGEPLAGVGGRRSRRAAPLPPPLPLADALPRTPPTSVYLTFDTMAARDAAAAAIAAGGGPRAADSARAAAAARAAWLARRLDNFSYLLTLNLLAGRSFHDLERYPVFPWVVADYTSAALDVENPSTFRDLSRPVGALAPKRLASFRARFRDLEEAAECAAAPGGGGGERAARAGCCPCRRRAAAPPPPSLVSPFLYGCHYSTPGYAAFWLLRPAPQLSLRLQGGRHDEPDRLFASLPAAWRSVTTLPTDVKELIPEFYMGDGSLFTLRPGSSFGVRRDGRPVGDVELPPWARGDAGRCAALLAAALESRLATDGLPAWIDLIFGPSSHGAGAAAADNVFHPLTYDGPAAAALAAAAGDAGATEAVLAQVAEFGRAPVRLFAEPHPRRREQEGGEGCGGGEAAPEPALAPPPPSTPPVAPRPSPRSFAVAVPEWLSDSE